MERQAFTNSGIAMPIYDYQCRECGSNYDVFHKVREVGEDVVCPRCGSGDHLRLLSAAGFTVGKKASEPPCAAGECCGGSCDFN
jgi:putative FmdB family regulatory protein